MTEFLARKRSRPLSNIVGYAQACPAKLLRKTIEFPPLKHIGNVEQLVADRNGLSYYSYDKICSVLRISVDEYILARNALIDQDMIAFDGYLFQVLSLPEKVTRPVSKTLKSQEQMQTHDPATIRQLTLDAFWGK